MLADFAVVPIDVTGGASSRSRSPENFDESGLSYSSDHAHHHRRSTRSRHGHNCCHCHRRMLGCTRMLTSITIDDRKGATGRLEGKVRDVEQVLRQEAALACLETMFSADEWVSRTECALSPCLQCRRSSHSEVCYEVAVMKSRQGHKGYVIEARSYEQPDGGSRGALDRRTSCVRRDRNSVLPARYVSDGGIGD